MANGCLPEILAFVELLNEMRFGKLSEQSKSRLAALSRQVKYTDSVEPTELCVPVAFSGRCLAGFWVHRFPTKREVQFANESRLAKLGGMARTFRSVDHAGNDDKDQYITPQQAKTLLDRCVLAPETMTLKVRRLSVLNIFLNGLTSPTLGWCTSDVDQGAEAHLPYNTCSYTRTECRARSAC